MSIRPKKKNLCCCCPCIAALIAQPFLFFSSFIPRVIENQRRSERKTKKMACLCVFLSSAKSGGPDRKSGQQQQPKFDGLFSSGISVHSNVVCLVLSSKKERKEIFFVSRTRSLCLSPKHFQTINVNKIPSFSFPMDGARLLRLLLNTRTRKVRFPLHHLFFFFFFFFF
jgi:hypothetical protein